ncbi:hypothetical protein CRG98_013020, partial [Punica granatum]
RQADSLQNCLLLQLAGLVGEMMGAERPWSAAVSRLELVVHFFCVRLAVGWMQLSFNTRQLRGSHDMEEPL